MDVSKMSQMRVSLVSNIFGIETFVNKAPGHLPPDIYSTRNTPWTNTPVDIYPLWSNM